MAANLTPQYLQAEADYKKAQTPEDRLECLKKMVQLVPDRKSTRLNSSHLVISYAVFCLKKKKIIDKDRSHILPTILIWRSTASHTLSISTNSDATSTLPHPRLFRTYLSYIL